MITTDKEIAENQFTKVVPGYYIFKMRIIIIEDFHMITRL